MSVWQKSGDTQLVLQCVQRPSDFPRLDFYVRGPETEQQDLSEYSNQAVTRMRIGSVPTTRSLEFGYSSDGRYYIVLDLDLLDFFADRTGDQFVLSVPLPGWERHQSYNLRNHEQPAARILHHCDHGEDADY